MGNNIEEERRNFLETLEDLSDDVEEVGERDHEISEEEEQEIEEVFEEAEELVEGNDTEPKVPMSETNRKLKQMLEEKPKSSRKYLADKTRY